MGLRLVNGYMQHWRLHQSKENRLVLPVESTEFGRPLRVDLQHSNWKLFDADGTVDRGPLKPDFSVIASVNLSLGGFEELEQRPTKGSGVLDIHELRLE
ncbi:hypothetical protein [Novipirellula sp.]|uniref:hypothetical protein n=1 Tax=Novipirellula sp. TaxID=2795430 RepID=UPI003566F6CA